LRNSGISTPLALETRNVTPPVLHSLASWVWAAGGDFVSKEGTRTFLNKPETREGVRSFLELNRFLPPDARGLELSEAESLFWQGHAAVSLSWQPPCRADLEKIAAPEVIDNLGISSVLGSSFLGGSNLVIWRHVPIRNESLALELVRFLGSKEVQSAFNPKIGFFPTRPELLQEPPFVNDEFHQVLMKELNSGRSFPSITIWSIIENRLLNMLNHLWEEVLAHPNLDLDDVVTKQLNTLAGDLDNMLSSH